MEQKKPTYFEEVRDNIFLFIFWIMLFLLCLSVGVILAIKAPGLLKFAGAGMIVGSFYMLSYFPTFLKQIKN